VIVSSHVKFILSLSKEGQYKIKSTSKDGFVKFWSKSADF
jgi:hypothetical protein